MKQTCGRLAFALIGFGIGCLVAALNGQAMADPGIAITKPDVQVWGTTPLAPAKPELTELERVQLENVNLMMEVQRAQLDADTCRGQLAQPRANTTGQQITQKLNDLKARIATQHPGFTWDPTTGTFTPAPPAKPEKD